MAQLDRDALKQMIRAQEADQALASAVTQYRRSLKGVETGKGGKPVATLPINEAADGLAAALNDVARSFGHEVLWTVVPIQQDLPLQPQKPAKK